MVPRDSHADGTRSKGGRHRSPRRGARPRSRPVAQRATLVRTGIAAGVLVALGLGVAIGVKLGSGSSTPAPSGTHKPSGRTTDGSSSATTSSTTTSTNATSVPAVLSCGPSSTPHVRPATITIGCATGAVTVTSITWKEWGADTGGQGSGTLNVNNCQPNCAAGTSRSTAAIVVVFHPVSGIFQDVSITPTAGVPATPKPPTTTSTTIPLTTTTSNGIAPVAASQPGSGWGGD